MAHQKKEIDFTVDPLRQRNWIYKSYERQILHFQRQGNRLLQIINIHETRMNIRRRQNLQPDQNELNYLFEMTKNMLRIICLVRCYRYFQSINELLTERNHAWFCEILNNLYIDLLRQINAKLVSINEQRDNTVDFFVVK